MPKNNVELDFLSGLEDRAALVNKLKSKLEGMPQKDQEQVDLKPLMQWADTLTGNATAQGYEKPKSKLEELKMKLQQQVDKEKQGIADDQLKYLQGLQLGNDSAEKAAYRNAMLRLAMNKKDSGKQDLMKLQFYKSDDAKKLKVNKNFDDKLKVYESLINQYGYQPVGQGAAKLDQAFYELGTAYKESKDLGAITGPDWEIIKGNVAPMTGVSGLVKNIAGGGTKGIQDALSQLKNSISKESDTAANSAEYVFGPELVRGYQQNILKQSPNQMKNPNKKIVSNGSQTLEIDPSDLESALAEGFQEVAP